MISANFIFFLKQYISMAKITVEQLAKDVEELKKRVEYLESQLLTKRDIIEIEEFLKRKEQGKLELLPFDDVLKELGIDETEIRKEISKETK